MTDAKDNNDIVSLTTTDDDCTEHEFGIFILSSFEGNLNAAVMCMVCRKRLGVERYLGTATTRIIAAQVFGDELLIETVDSDGVKVNVTMELA